LFVALAQGVVFSEFSALGQRNKQLAGQAKPAIPAQPAGRDAPVQRRVRPAATADKAATPAAPAAAPAVVSAPPTDAVSAAKIVDQWLRQRALTERDTRLCELAMRSWTQIPVIHLLVDLAQCPQGQLADTLDALGAQLLANWHLTVIADAPAPDAMFEELEQLHWVQVQAGADRAGVMTGAVEAVATEWVTLIGAGDRIAPHYTFMFAEAVNRHPDWRFIYCDEDSVDRAGARGAPQFKPDFNLDLLRSMPYIGNGCAVRRDVLLAQGGYLCADAIAHYNTAFQVLERDGEAAIGHIAEVLYHRSAGNERLRDSNEINLLGQAVLTTHLQRRGIDAGVQPGQYPGSYFIDYRHPARPRVSIIIPTRDQADLLKPCVESLLERTEYADFEVLIVDNRTTQKEALAFMDEVSARDRRVRVLRYPHPYNFSAINNTAAREATGDYLLLLNNDTMIVQANWLERMLAHAQRPEVGAVGARLIYANQSLQHAGIVLGMGGHGVAEHVHLQLPMSDAGHMGRAQVVQNYSVVTGACLLVSKALYDEVGGLDEQRFGVMFNDVDLCLKLGTLGRKVVWTPYATLIHHGSVSLKKAETPETAERARREVQAMYATWLPKLAHDPAFNDQLCLMEQRVWVPEIEIDAGIRVESGLPRIVGMGMGSEGSWHYRGVAPLTALADAAEARATLIPKFKHRIRLPSVAEIERLGTDAVLAYNTVHESYIAGLEAIKTHTDVFISFGLDDLASELPQKNPFRKTIYKDIKKRIRSALQHSHRLIVTTEPLAEAHRGMIDDIVVLPNYLERARWTTLTSQRGAGRRPRVGWAGALQHQGDLEVIEQVVKETAQEIEWVFMGMCPKSLRPYITEFHEAIEYDAYPAKLATLDLDLALAPLEYHRFNECKSNLRLLEYGVLGWPVVCTNIHPYQDAPVERVPNNPRAWLTAIRDRIHNLDATHAEGDRLREWVLQHWILEDHLDRWLAALNPAAGNAAIQTPPARHVGGV
jgi:GT2 family glycosyltransferase